MTYLMFSLKSRFCSMYHSLCKKLYELKDNEPPKIFRKIHKEWEQAVEKLEKQYDMAFNSYMEQCQELEELMKLAKIEN